MDCGRSRIVCRAHLITLSLVVSGCAAVGAGVGAPRSGEDREITLTSGRPAFLRVPEGTGPFPVVFILPDVGMDGADGVVFGQANFAFGFAFPTYASLADSLSERGIASVRFLPRWPDANQPDGPINFDAALADARDAFARTTLQPQIDSAQVLVVTHGSGALLLNAFSPLHDDNAAALPSTTRIVLVDPPADSLAAVLEHYRDTGLELLAAEGRLNDRRGVLGAADEAVEALSQRHMRGADKDVVSNWPLAAWRDADHRLRDFPMRIAAFEQVVYVVVGDASTHVSLPMRTAWQEALAATPDRFVEMPCLSHALICLPGEPFFATDPATVSAQVHAPIVDLFLSSFAVPLHQTAPISP